MQATWTCPLLEGKLQYHFIIILAVDMQAKQEGIQDTTPILLLFIVHAFPFYRANNLLKPYAFG